MLTSSRKLSAVAPCRRSLKQAYDPSIRYNNINTIPPTFALYLHQNGLVQEISYSFGNRGSSRYGPTSYEYIDLRLLYYRIVDEQHGRESDDPPNVDRQHRCYRKL